MHPKSKNPSHYAIILPLIVTVLVTTCLAFVYAQRQRRNAGTQNNPARSSSPKSTPFTRSGKTLAVPPRGDLQTALDIAQPGDEIVLEAGASYRGPFTLRRKAGDGSAWITVRSSRLAELPGDGVRVSPAHAALMPKLTAQAAGPALRTEDGAHHYRLIGIEVMPADEREFIYNLIALGSDAQTSRDQVPHHINLDRCYIHGHPGYPTRRGIALNSAHTEVTNSYLAEFKEVGQDSQAIMGWTGPGPFKITNNYLEAAGENIMFGGGAARIPGLVPSDIEIRGNHLRKPLRWKPGTADYDGVGWSVKNLFELKNARRVLVDGNLMENNWAYSQAGFGVLFTVRGEDGAMPWASVADVDFINNVIRNSTHGINILGKDTGGASEQVKRINISNNLFETRKADGHLSGDFLQVTEAADVSLAHNTVLMDLAVRAYGQPTTGFKLRDNLFAGGGMHGDGTGGGSGMFARFFPGALVRGNVFGGMEMWAYQYTEAMQADNRFTGAKLTGAEFANAAAGDYRLAASSQFRGTASDGKDVGCDFSALRTAVSLVVTGGALRARD
jgi:hypothetical protein